MALGGAMLSDHAVERDRVAQRLFTPLPGRYDRLAELLSFGQNGRWRHEMVGHVVGAAPRRVLDVASGTAGVALQLAQRGGAEVVGVDLTEAMLGQGRRNVAAAGLSTRVVLTAGRAQQLPFADASFDGLTFTYLLRYVDDPEATLGELARVLRPGGPVASLEFYVPPNPFWRLCWEGYTRLVLPAAGWVSGGRQWFEVGRFLGPSISEHYRRYPLAWTEAAWRRAGLEPAGSRVMSLGGGLVMWGSRRP
jgi:demethylmenaquinone methyltransferase/2-methoxy-6-polyprenyl-1,4-benzoquinol methylase